MPFYELFCLGRASLARAEQADLFRLASKTILTNGGVLTDLKNFGERTLAYKISHAGGLHSEAFTWQIGFAASPSALAPLERALKLDERILRHILVKTDPFEAKPTAHSVGEQAKRLLQQAENVKHLQAIESNVQHPKFLWATSSGRSQS